MFSKDAGIWPWRISALACLAKLDAITAWLVGCVVAALTICPWAFTVVVVSDPSAFALVVVVSPDALVPPEPPPDLKPDDGAARPPEYGERWPMAEEADDKAEMPLMTKLQEFAGDICMRRARVNRLAARLAVLGCCRSCRDAQARPAEIAG
jgi:hypothetical protein